MNQEDINELIAKNPSPEAKLNAGYINNYTRDYIVQVVKELFHRYASTYTQDALTDLRIILRR